MSRCVSVLAFVVFSTALATSTHAQNPQRWSGPYIGANIGRGSAELDGSAILSGGAGTTLSHSVDAVGRSVASRPVSITASAISSSAWKQICRQRTSQDRQKSVPVRSTYTASASLDWFATARARTGFATNAMLVYVTGGVAFGGMDYDATIKTGNHQCI